jgi:hypothetical protein
MALVTQGTQDDDELFNCLVEVFSFWQAFILSLWSFFICCHKVFEFFLTLIRGLFKKT